MNSVRFAFTALWMIALGLPALAVEKADLTGQWKGYYTEDPKAKEEMRVKFGFDFWVIKDEVEGVVSLDVLLLETMRVSVSSPKLVIEVEPMMPKGMSAVYNCEYSVSPQGEPTIKGTYVGRNGNTIAWLEVKKVPEKGRVAVEDKVLNGAYKATATGGTVKPGAGFDVSLSLTLEGDEVGGKVALQGLDVQSGKAVKEERKLEEIRRGLDRIFLKWTDAKGNAGKILGTASRDGITGICNAGSLGAGSVVLARK